MSAKHECGGRTVLRRKKLGLKNFSSNLLLLRMLLTDKRYRAKKDMDWLELGTNCWRCKRVVELKSNQPVEGEENKGRYSDPRMQTLKVY